MQKRNQPHWVPLVLPMLIGLFMSGVALVSMAPAAPTVAQGEDVPYCDLNGSALLVFSKTAGFRHSSIAAGNTALQAIANDEGWTVAFTEDSTQFTAENLANYDAVIFNNTTGDILDNAQQVAFEDYIRAGGAFMGIHAATDTEYDWPFYGGLVGAYFEQHPPGTQNADLMIEDAGHSSAMGLPDPWARTDEWYKFQQNPTNVTVVMSLDNESLVEDLNEPHKSTFTGQYLPMAWYHVYEGARSYYTAMGHTSSTFSEPLFRDHLTGALQWILDCDPLDVSFTSAPDGANPLEVQFEASVSGGQEPYTYTWDFGDGTGDTVLDAAPSYTYAAGGIYSVTLTITDDDSNTANITQQVNVVEASTATPTPTDTATATSEVPPTPTDDGQPTATPTDEGGATATPTDNPGATATPTTDPNELPTETPVGGVTETLEPTIDPNITATPTSELTPSATAATATPGVTPSATATNDPDNLQPGELAVDGDLDEGTVRPTFVWRPETLEDWYNLIISTSGNMLILDKWMLAADVCNGTLCAYTPTEAELPAGLVNGTYLWAVRGWSDNVLSDFSDTQTFTVEVPVPVVPTGFTVDASTGRPVIMFADDPGTAWLHVYIARNFANVVDWRWYEKQPENCTAGMCTLYLSADPANGDYVAYMQAWGPAGFNATDPEAWAGPALFDLNLPAAELIAPGSASINNGEVTLSWNAANYATWYQLWVGTAAPAFETAHVMWYPMRDLGCAGGGTCSVTLTDLSLTAGEDYVWYVQTWGPGGQRLNEGEQGWQQGGTFAP
ncbi:MAG: hypothetical protein OHK0046_26070 [Anaerolineae bacterium]